MGEHESAPSGKRYRRGTPIKYRHPGFHISSTASELAGIKRRTCPSNEKQMLSAALKQARARESQMNLEVLRLEQRIKQARSDIATRKKALHDYLTQGDLSSGPALRPLTPTPALTSEDHNAKHNEGIDESGNEAEKEKETASEQRAPRLDADAEGHDAVACSYNDQLSDIILSAGLDESEISDALSLTL